MTRRRSRRGTRGKLTRAVKLPRVSARMNVFSFTWFLIAATLLVFVVLTQSVVAIVGMLLSTVVGVASLFAGSHASVPAKRTSVGKTVNRRGNTTTRRSLAKSGTGRKRPKCSARCQWSVKPKKTCQCSCGGELHGTRSGSSYGESRTWLNSTAAKKQEKRMVSVNERRN